MKSIWKWATLLLMALALLSLQACGHYGHRRGGYYGSRQVNSAYYEETANLRSEIAADRAELDALMRSPDPDPERARNLAQEISRNEERLRTLQANSQGYGACPYGW